MGQAQQLTLGWGDGKKEDSRKQITEKSRIYKNMEIRNRWTSVTELLKEKAEHYQSGEKKGTKLFTSWIPENSRFRDDKRQVSLITPSFFLK